MVEVPDAALGELARDRAAEEDRAGGRAVRRHRRPRRRARRKGEGLGNKFLANIRETDAIVHVVRCFEDADVTHVMGGVDPVRDREVIEFELALADLGVVEKRLDRVKRSAKTGDKDAMAELPVLEKAHEFLKDGRGLWEAKLTADELALLKPLSLLTVKPVLYAANVTDAELSGEEGPHLKALRARDRGERRAGRGRSLLRQDRSRAGRAAAGGSRRISSRRSASSRPGSTG